MKLDSSQVKLELEDQKNTSKRPPTSTCQKFINKQGLQIYYNVLSYSKLIVKEEIDFRNVNIYQKDHIHQIYTKNQDNQKLPYLLLIHGFGGTALMFNHVFAQTFKKYRVHSIDIFGCGYSSRGGWTQKQTAQEAQKYHVSAIQQWRKTLNINQFQLAGHSFGAYLGARYAKKFPNRISRLVLLSPAGFRVKEPQQWDDLSNYWKLRYKVGGCIFKLGWGRYQSLNVCIGQRFMLEQITGCTLNLKGQQKEAWKKYFLHIHQQGDSSQDGFYKMIQWPSIPKLQTIEQILKQSKFPFRTQVYYGDGDNDWIQQTERASKKIPKMFDSDYVFCENIPGGNHQLLSTVPKQVAQKLVRSLKFNNK